ncbi:hypothetical protein evm_008380 [Chilo suppressalis]|nr:hypothetical protein evm_008380 [Chilo suppressalis]
MLKFELICFITVVCARYVKSGSPVDELKSTIQSKLLSTGIDCIKEYPLSLSDIKAFKEKRIPNNKDAKCFAACLFKKIGIMDDMGKLNAEKAKESAKQAFKNEEHTKKTEDIINSCAEVNEQTTSDGNKGCERAKLAFECLKKNAPMHGFDFDI